MTLRDLIDELSKHPADQVVPMGFHNPHSHRGDYSELAFEPRSRTTVGEMLDAARSAVGTTYEGWKGGEFTMNEWTQVYLATEGYCGEGIGPVLLWYMLGKFSDDDKQDAS